MNVSTDFVTRLLFQMFWLSVACVVGRLIREAVGRLPCVVSPYQTTERRRSIYRHLSQH